MTGYRVELLLTPSNAWVVYTSRKKLLSEEMARSLAAHLQRSKTGYRIIAVEKKQERIIEEWTPTTGICLGMS